MGVEGQEDWLRGSEKLELIGRHNTKVVLNAQDALNSVKMSLESAQSAHTATSAWTHNTYNNA